MAFVLARLGQDAPACSAVYFAVAMTPLGIETKVADVNLEGVTASSLCGIEFCSVTWIMPGDACSQGPADSLVLLRIAGVSEAEEARPRRRT